LYEFESECSKQKAKPMVKFQTQTCNTSSTPASNDNAKAAVSSSPGRLSFVNSNKPGFLSSLLEFLSALESVNPIIRVLFSQVFLI
jgi:hypothetical protein